MCFLERMSGFILDLSRLWALFSRVKQPRPVHAPGNRTPHLIKLSLLSLCFPKNICNEVATKKQRSLLTQKLSNDEWFFHIKYSYHIHTKVKVQSYALLMSDISQTDLDVLVNSSH